MSQKPPDEQDSSDALPYTQVHRAVKPKAALLAAKLGVTPQHALGSLVEFWDLCAGDQRDLERILETTPPGQEPAIVLSPAEVAGRFELASGVQVEPVTLERLGLLEQRPDGFRVRGMSRYFAPITRKVVLRARASKGGLASAASRAGAQAGAQAHAQAGASTYGKSAEAVSSEHEAVRNKKRAEASRASPGKPKKPKAQAELPDVIPPKPPPLVERVHAYFLEVRVDRCAELGLGEPPPPDEPPNWARSAATIATWVSLRSNPEAGEVLAKLIISAFCDDPYWAGATNRDTKEPQPYPWNALLSEKVWKRLVEQIDRGLDEPEAGAA